MARDQLTMHDMADATTAPLLASPADNLARWPTRSAQEWVDDRQQIEISKEETLE